MTETPPDYNDHTPTPNPKPAPPPPKPKSGRGLAGLALLLALGAGGASGYLWYLWQQEQLAQTSQIGQAVRQALAPQATQLADLQQQIKNLQALKDEFEKARAANQTLREQLLGLTGDVQPLKNTLELQKGESGVLRNELKLLRESQETARSALEKQQQGLETGLQAQDDRLKQLDERLKNAQLAYNGLAESLDGLKITAAKGGDVNAFPLTEVDYLLRLADHKLSLERNLPTARQALEVAQKRLKVVDEAALTAVQTMLTEALGSLRGVKLPDLSALAHKLIEMREQVATLPLKVEVTTASRNPQDPPAEPAASTDSTQPWWDRASDLAWKEFKELVIIRRTGSQALPLIALEQEFFLRQNLLLELESMRMALLSDNAASYQDSLKLVNEWVNTYFNTQHTQVTDFQEQLKALGAVQFNPYIPDLSGLTQAFHQAMARRQPVRAISPPASAASATPAVPDAPPASTPAVGKPQ